MQITSEAIQRWIRVFLYWLFGAIGWSGVVGGFSLKEMIISGVGTLVTIAWTKYGSSLNAMLTEVEKTAGVEKVDVKVDPTVIKPSEVNAATPAAVTVTPS